MSGRRFLLVLLNTLEVFMHYTIVIPGDFRVPPTCALEGSTLDDLVKSLSHFTRTHTIAWIGNNYPHFIFTLVEK